MSEDGTRADYVLCDRHGCYRGQFDEFLKRRREQMAAKIRLYYQSL